MSLERICADCRVNCCDSFLKKPELYGINDTCRSYKDKKCTLYTSKIWEERLLAGRTLLCELFPAVVSLPKVENNEIIIEVHQNDNCPKAKEILKVEDEKKKVVEIVNYIFDSIKNEKALNMPWFQYHLFKKCFLKNRNKKIKVVFTGFEFDHR